MTMKVKEIENKVGQYGEGEADPRVRVSVEYEDPHGHGDEKKDLDGQMALVIVAKQDGDEAVEAETYVFGGGDFYVYETMGQAVGAVCKNIRENEDLDPLVQVAFAKGMFEGLTGKTE